MRLWGAESTATLTAAVDLSDNCVLALQARSAPKPRRTGAVRREVDAGSARLHPMTFGQQLGPPASPRQLQELLALLNAAGHTDFRDARGPMGFSQRQAGGRFTRTEAEELIERLQGEDPGPSYPSSVSAARLSTQEQLMRQMPAEQLAAELRRRGWAVTEP